ncbi:MAG: ATP-dependent RNA helicase HrpA [Anaerolineae bacterium]|nr:ATP-dependent RNA helicase HrpA [Phycisphaerae bacterium]
MALNRFTPQQIDDRRARLPRPTFADELPIAQRKREIAELIERNQVVVVCGETGSGKTTQLPKICLELGRGVTGMIGHTQPRRIAARTVATRIAQELGVVLRNEVGYKIRFGDVTSRDTYVKLMTDGILLAETQHDRLLQHYDTLIIDEAHERSLNIDFLLGYIKQLLPKRPDLRVIITSATIDPQRFSRHFNDAPIIEVSGRMYPVDVRYRPLRSVEELEHDEPLTTPSGSSGSSRKEDDLDPIDGIVRAVDELWSKASGDTLVFLPGEREIRDTADALRNRFQSHVEVLPLYGRLSSDQQMKVFQPSKQKRIVLATNVAETSLTVPGIRYVVDLGLARLSRYNARTKVQRLPIEPISQASADQRKGRCGRVSEGVCVRLYSEEDFSARTAYTEPEILRTSLASVILQMKYLNLGPIEEFPFLDPPDTRQIRDGYHTLRELAAIDEENELTNIGRSLARLPVDPRIGRMCLQAIEEDCLDEMLIIAAALSVQDPRDRPMDQQEAADQAHGKYRDETSDFLSFLRLWNFLKRKEQELSSRQFRKFCRENFLSFIRVREWQDVHAQLAQQIHELGERRKRITPSPSTLGEGREEGPQRGSHRRDHRIKGAPR